MPDPAVPGVPGRDRSSVAVLASTIRTLPALPGSIHDLLLLNVQDPDLSERLQAVIERDPALASHVIKLGNSSAFSGQTPVNTLRAAIQRVGAALIIGNALQGAVHRVFDPYGGMGPRLGATAILEANVMAAIAAATVSRLGIQPEIAYLHGLIHDIGHLVMALKLGEDLEALDHRAIPADQLCQRETAEFGFDHQQAGRLLANHWKLPDDLTVVIASHHFPRELRQGQQVATNTVIDMLALADRACRLVEEEPPSRAKAEARVEAWLGSPAAQPGLLALGATPAEIGAAVSAALAAAERDGRLSAGAD